MSVLTENKNIVSCYALYKYNSKYAILQELMEIDLQSFMRKEDVNRSEMLIGYVIKEIIKGLQEFHENNKIHRDLKSSNILINSKGNVKIGDFGISVQLTVERKKRMTLAGSLL